MDLAEGGAIETVERTKVNALVRLARPYQWIKNGLVFAALVFSRRLFHFHDIVLTVHAFIAFCAIASAGYAINDINDRESDQHHPEKQPPARHRRGDRRRGANGSGRVAQRGSVRAFSRSPRRTSRCSSYTRTMPSRW